MSQDIRIPDIGDADDVEVVEIIAAAGDEIGEDDPIIVIESDKASMEVPAGKAGKIEEITVAVGDKVSEGQVIARIAAASESGEDDSSADQDDSEASSADPSRERPSGRDSADADEPGEGDDAGGKSSRPGGRSHEGRASGLLRI